MFEEVETEVKLKKINFIEYDQPQLIVANELSVKSQFITEYSVYSSRKDKQKEVTHGVVSLNFQKNNNEITQTQGQQAFENIQVINKILLVVDRSQSMIKQYKLDNVKKCLLQLFMQSKPNQQFGLISFGNSHKIHFKFETVQSDNKQRLIEELKSITATGQTNIVKALQTAHGVIEEDYIEEQKKNNNNCSIRYMVVLLTDGYDNVKEKALSQIREFYKNIQMKYSITCLGFGDEYDPHLLSGIASYTGGKLYSIKATSDLQPVFDECIALFENVIVEDLEIELEEKEQIRLKDHHSNDYTFLSRQIEQSTANNGSLNRAYYKLVRENDEKNVLYKVKYAIVNEKSFKEKIDQIEQKQKNDQDIQNISNQFSFNDKRQQLSERKSNNMNQNENETQMNSSCSSISFLGDLSNSSEDANEYDIIETSERNKIDDDSEKVEKYKPSRKIIDNANNEYKTQMESKAQDDNTDTSEYCVKRRNNCEDEITVTIGSINVMFKYKGQVYKFSVPMTIKFKPLALVKKKTNDKVVISLIRNKYLDIQKESNQCFKNGEYQKSLNLLQGFQKELEKHKLNSFQIYKELSSKNKSLINNIKQYMQTEDDEEQKTYKRDFFINQEMTMFRFKDSTQTI